jgi:Domain of unknown function (DUF4232)
MRAGLLPGLLLAVVVLAAAGCGGTKTVTETATVVRTTTVRVTTQQAAPATTACTGDAMAGSFSAIPGSGAAGQISYRLRVKNAAPVACFVSGLPNVQLLDRRGRVLPTNVSPEHPGQGTAARIVLEPGASASADARFSPDVPGGSEQTDGPCEAKAYTLRVAFGGAPLDVPVTPPTPVCERGSMTFSLFAAA